MLEDDLSDDKRYSFNNFLDSAFGFINRWGTLGPRVIVHDFKVYFSSQKVGTVHKRKCGVRGLLSSASLIIGGLLPTVFLPTLGLEVQSVFLQIMGLTPGVSFASAVLLISLLCGMLGTSVSGHALELIFNRYYKTPHTKLYFTAEEKQELMNNPNLKVALDNEHTLDNMIQFLQNEYNYKITKDGVKKHHLKILELSDYIRTGNISKLQSYLEKKVSYHSNPTTTTEQSPLTPQQQTDLFLKRLIKKPEWQIKFLVKLIDVLSTQEQKQPEQSRATELLALLTHIEDEDHLLVPEVAATVTPMAKQDRKKQKVERAENLQQVLDELKPNVKVKVAQ